MARLKDQYKNEIADAMQKKFGYKNVMEIPKLDKIVINMGVGEAKENAKALESAVRDMETIAGQKAVITKAKKSCTAFEKPAVLHQNQPVIRKERHGFRLRRAAVPASPRPFPDHCHLRAALGRVRQGSRYHWRADQPYRQTKIQAGPPGPRHPLPAPGGHCSAGRRCPRAGRERGSSGDRRTFADV